MLQEKYEEWISNRSAYEDRSLTSRHVREFFEDVFGEDMIVVLSSSNHTHSPSMRNSVYKEHPCLIVMSRENAKHIENNIRDSTLYVKDSYMGQVVVDVVNDNDGYYNDDNYSYCSYFMDILELIPCNPVTDDPDRFFTVQTNSSIVLEGDGVCIPISENVKNPEYIRTEDLGLCSFLSSFVREHLICCYRLIK